MLVKNNMFVRILVLVSILIPLSACVETIEMNPEEDLPVVVQCLIIGERHKTDEIVQHLELYYAKGKSSAFYKKIDSAKAYITREVGYRDTVGIFERVSDTHWQFNAYLPARYYYDLHIEIPGREPIKAVTKMPHEFQAVSNRGTLGILDYNMNQMGSIGQMEVAKDNHNLWIVARHGRHFFIDEREERDTYPYIVTDNPNADNFNVTGLKFKDLDFTQPPVGLYSEYWQTVQNRQKRNPDLALHKDFIRIAQPAAFSNGLTDDEKKQQSRDVRFDDFLFICGPQECPISTDLMDQTYKIQHYDIYSFSDDYDKFLRDVYSRDHGLKEDLTAVYSTENVHSNIEGGIGIFGAYIFSDVSVYSN